MLSLAFVIVAVILFILAGILNRPSIPMVLLCAGLAFWAGAQLVGRL
jgi:hypothetical protein